MPGLTSNPENVEVELLWGWKILIKREFLRPIYNIVKHQTFDFLRSISHFISWDPFHIWFPEIHLENYKTSLLNIWFPEIHFQNCKTSLSNKSLSTLNMNDKKLTNHDSNKRHPDEEGKPAYEESPHEEYQRHWSLRLFRHYFRKCSACSPVQWLTFKIQTFYFHFVPIK